MQTWSGKDVTRFVEAPRLAARMRSVTAGGLVACEGAVHDPAMDAIEAETSLSTEAVIERRLSLAAALLGWTPPRVAAFREGYAQGGAGAVDRARRHRHGHDDGFDEAALAPALVDALGYADGVSAAEAAALPAVAFHSPEEILSEADAWAGNGDGDFEVDEAEWAHSAADGLASFLPVMGREEWVAWFVDEHRMAIEAGRPGYGDLLLQDIREPVVYVAYGDGRADVWDGYHRLGAAMAKGAGSVPSIKGVPPAPTPRP
jgi:hypothetical protein